MTVSGSTCSATPSAAVVRLTQAMRDLAPPGGDPAPGNDAASVAERDRPALVAVEDAFLGSDPDDPALGRGRDALDDSGARDVPGDRGADGLLAALRMRVSGAGEDVGLIDRDDQRRRRTADRGQQPG